MAKILIIGFTFTHTHNVAGAFVYRTRQLIKIIQNEGHSIYLIVPSDISDIKSIKHSSNFIEYISSKNSVKRIVNRVLKTTEIDCALGIGVHGSSVLRRLKLQIPQWYDIYGDPIVESQLAHYAKGRDAGIWGPIENYKKLLKSGDKFSTVSNAQKWALLGGLGIVGRLSATNSFYNFICSIPADIITEDPINTENKNVLKGVKVPEDAFIVTWSGGYNVWSDPSTLFLGLERAISKNKKIYFVSTGYPVVSKRSFDYLIEMISKSKYKDHYLMLGKQPWNTLVKIWLESDLGIVTDIECYETFLGSRTRVLDMLNYGLPSLISDGTELAHLLDKNKYGYIFNSGSPRALSQLLLELVERGPKKIQSVSLNIDYEPIKKWLANPLKSPDNINKHSIFSNIIVSLRKIRHYFK